MITPQTVMSHPAEYDRAWFEQVPDGFDPVNDLTQPVTWINEFGRYRATRRTLRGVSPVWYGWVLDGTAHTDRVRAGAWWDLANNLGVGACRFDRRRVGTRRRFVARP